MPDYPELEFTTTALYTIEMLPDIFWIWWLNATDNYKDKNRFKGTYSYIKIWSSHVYLLFCIQFVNSYTTSISMVNLCQILCGIYVDHNIIKITKDNTVGLEDCFFMRETNTWLIFQKDCV